MKELRFKRINIFFSIFVLLFILNLFLPVSSKLTYTSRMWLILELCVVLISIYLLFKNKLPEKPYIILS